MLMLLQNLLINVVIRDFVISSCKFDVTQFFLLIAKGTKRDGDETFHQSYFDRKNLNVSSFELICFMLQPKFLLFSQVCNFSLFFYWPKFCALKFG